MRTEITQDEYGYVTLAYDCRHTGERVTVVYNCPRDGGYVRSADGSQVCDGLSSTGSTLKASPDRLLAVIRREYRAMRRAESKTFNY